jgi:hypothetical protein
MTDDGDLFTYTATSTIPAKQDEKETPVSQVRDKDL